MKLSEYKEKIISKYGNELWEEIERSYAYLVYKAPEEEQLEMVKRNPYAIKFINNSTEEMQIEAIKCYDEALQYINNPTDNLIEEAIKEYSDKNSYKFKYLLRFMEKD
jgi:hypothetical protein cdifQCD-7_19572